MKHENGNQIVAVSDDALTQALVILGNGGLVAVPTETVYGLAADATNGEAVAGIFSAKGRPQFNPLICHVSSLEMAQEFAVFDEASLALTNAFWPGPLTLVLPLKDNTKIHPLVTAGLDTIGLRFPKGLTAELIAQYGKPLAAPSANASGKISPTTALAVQQSLGNKVDLILDDGPCAVGLESTIVKVAGDTATILRPGGITLSDLEKMSHLNLLEAEANASIQAPGMMTSHYAPNALMRLDAEKVVEGEALLAFGSSRITGADQAVKILNLSPTGDLIEAASNLFSMMSELDNSNVARIAVEPVPMSDIGIAINDRLKRAAAPRG
ncbi:L-threonylcarbamoyladenylate synthase [Ahrensia marina]|uniref:L-threonylcarbamoyladenylate synthase n=1 Tax=Ahrensia marina TaxID=1514904 RepID=UPI0006B63093|nr:L-threonylcarbamoyladenylate synthase [Ahrensia marina]